MNTLLGTKVGMVSSYDARGRRVGATVVSVKPNFITQLKTADGKDGYGAVQLGMSEKKSVSKPQVGHFKKAGVEKKLRYVKEARVESTEGLSLGQELKISEVFKVGDSLKITGTSKGKGFQGGVRRHGFHGGPKTHGQSDRHRAPGSIGQGTTPGRVYKGKRMAGHMGVDKVSYKGVEVISVDKENELITLKGGVPGPIGGLIILEKQGVIKGYTPPPEPEPEVEEEVTQEQNPDTEQLASDIAEEVEVVEQPTEEPSSEVVENKTPEGESNA